MDLSDAELDLARRARQRVKFYESWRDFPRWQKILIGGFYSLFFILFLTLLMIAWLRGSSRDIRHTMELFIAFLYPLPLVQRYFRFKRQYVEDVRILDRLRAKAGGQFPIDLDLPADYSLLARWNRRPEKRAMLWRLDRILSRHENNA